MNKAMLIGYVGAEPQIKYLDQGQCVATVNLATTERGYTLPNGTQVPDRTEWHSCVFWRKLAEMIEKYVHKGDRIYVEGKIMSRDWTDRYGVKHRTAEIMVDSLELLTPRSASSHSGGVSPSGGERTHPAGQEAQGTPPAATPDKDGYPF